MCMIIVGTREQGGKHGRHWIKLRLRVALRQASAPQECGTAQWGCPGIHGASSLPSFLHTALFGSSGSGAVFLQLAEHSLEPGRKDGERSVPYSGAWGLVRLHMPLAV